jgi:hypothetical protein
MMSAMDPPAGGAADPGERLIGALALPPARRCRMAPITILVAALPALTPPTAGDPDPLLLDMARLDVSGRVSARGVLRALGWGAGHRIDLVVVGGAIVIGSSRSGRHVIGGRGDLGLPARARQLCGISPDAPVVLAASVRQAVLVVHPASVVAQLLAEHYAGQAGRDAGQAER